jgi:6,7-dimethyl-8-ribityllumazine synthase
MPRVIEASLVDQGGRYALVAARWNDLIVTRLVDGAVDTLRRHGVDTDNNVTLVWVPGSFEMPVVVSKLAKSGKYDAIIGLGCVIRGGTPHFEYVSSEVTKGLAAASMESGVPVSFGVLTVDTIDQAIERAGTKMGNKGHEAALAALEMVGLMAALDRG